MVALFLLSNEITLNVRVWKLSGKYYYPGNFGEIFDKKVQF
jgi:hypothetical protein